MRRVLKWTGGIIGSLIALVVVLAIVVPTSDKDEPKTEVAAVEVPTTTAEPEPAEVKAVKDVEGNSCDADETKYGRCPSSQDFGKTMAEARKAQAARGKAERARRAAERAEEERKAREEAAAAAEAERLANAWRQGFTGQHGDGIAYEWDNSVCDSSYYTCFGMRVVTRDGCGSLFVTLQLQDSAGNAIGTAIDSATALQPGQVAVLDFIAFEEGAKTARIAEVNCY